MSYINNIKSLFVDYNKELKRFVTRKLGNEADAEEIVQDAFHNFLQLEDTDKIENPRAFLYKTAHNLALNRIRKNKYHDKYVATLPEEQVPPSLERSVFAQRDIEVLQKHIGTLPERTRMIFLMSRIDAKSYPTISQELGVSVSSVEKHMMKALKFLRKHLDESAS